MLNKLDARGLSCPQPVLLTKKALDAMTTGTITTIVDNGAARENVTKFAAAQGCVVESTEQDGVFYLTITKGDVVPTAVNVPIQSQADSKGGLVFLLTRAVLGEGDDVLGAVLMKSFFVSIAAKEPLPKTILFLNGAVYLTVEGSPLLENIRDLAAKGVEILSCGTCLEHFNLKDKLAVGGVTNMYTVMERITDNIAVTI